MTQGRLIRILIASLVGLVLAGLIAWWSIQQELAERAAADGPATAGVSVPDGVTVGGDFALVDETGRPVSSADYEGKYRLMFFGFTFCPDICPTELQVIGAALDELGPQAEQIQPLFVTIDPARDNPKQIAEYTDLFDSRIVGLTGTESQIAEVARKFRVYYAKAPGEDAENYLMDHSTYTYLMGPDGDFLTVFPRGTTPDDMAKAIRQFMKG